MAAASEEERFDLAGNGRHSGNEGGSSPLISSLPFSFYQLQELFLECREFLFWNTQHGVVPKRDFTAANLPDVIRINQIADRRL